MTGMSVYDKATQLQSHVRRLSEGAAGEREALRIAQRLTDLRAALNTLGKHIEVAQALNRLGAGNLLDLSDADAGRAAFARKAQPGTLPLDAVFRTAVQKVKAVTERIDRDMKIAWADWASKRIAELPLSRIPMLKPDTQRSARNRRTSLERAAKRDALARADIELFKGSLSALAELLQQADDPPEALSILLDRLSERPLALREVTDEQIALLREHRMDDQIGLLRTSA